MSKESDKLSTYENTITVPKFNLMSLSQAEVEQQIEYLLFVEHSEDMGGYTHLRKIIPEVSKLVIHIADRAVAEFQRDMTYRIAKNLQETIGENISSVIYDATISTTSVANVSTIINDEKIVDQIVEVQESIHDW